MGLILAIDQGTTNSKALLLNREGSILSSASRPVGIHFPKSGWVEQNPVDIWQSVRDAALECLQNLKAESVIALGISNQRETVLAWERETGLPVSPCVSWQCQRGYSYCEPLKKDSIETMVRDRSGLGLDPMFSASKLAWILSETNGLQERAENGEICVGTIDSWLIWKLTNGQVHATDATNASRTLLMNLETAEWDDELLALFKIPRAALPQILPSSNFYGETSPKSGLPSGIPITGVAGDSHASMVGHCASSPGSVKATYGTGSSLMMLSPPSPTPALSNTLAWKIGDQNRHALEGNIISSGATVSWFAKFMGVENSDAGFGFPEGTKADGVYIVPAFSGLGAPHWITNAKAAISGLTFRTTPQNVARAALDSIAYQVADVLDAMQHCSGVDAPALLADGGASRNQTLMQFQADIIGRPVHRNQCTELSALGAALLAGIGVGEWQSIEDAQSIKIETVTYLPKMGDDERQSLRQGWQEALQKSLPINLK